MIENNEASLPPLEEIDGVLCHRSSSLWFEDGNIVIQAKDRLFRVYKGILSRTSIVFRDMFGLPLPNKDVTSVGESLEGCPVVKVYDEVREIEFFLRAIFDFK